MTVEDFTTYTELDPNNHLTVASSTHVDFKAYRNEDCRLYKDYGAGAISGNFTHFVDVTPQTYGGTDYGLGWVWGLSVDTVDDELGLKNANKTAVCVEISELNNNPILNLVEIYNGSRYITTNLVIGIWGAARYLKMVKVGTTLYCYIYTDSARTSQITGSPVSLVLHGDWSFRYVFASNTYNDGTNANKWTDLDIENLDLNPTLVFRSSSSIVFFADLIFGG